MARLLFQEWSFTIQCGVGVNGGGRSVCVCVVEREGRLGFGLFHWPAPSWANFSNLQTVWAQAQGSEAKDPALQDSRVADSSGSSTHITSGTPDRSRHTFSREGSLSRTANGTGPQHEEGRGGRRSRHQTRRKG